MENGDGIPPMSGRAKEALAHYRAVESVGPSARARILQAVAAQTGAPGPMPSKGSIAPRALASKGVVGSVAKLVVGAAMAAAVGWGAYRYAPYAKEIATPTDVPTSKAEVAPVVAERPVVVPVAPPVEHDVQEPRSRSVPESRGSNPSPASRDPGRLLPGPRTGAAPLPASNALHPTNGATRATASSSLVAGPSVPPPTVSAGATPPTVPPGVASPGSLPAGPHASATPDDTAPKGPDSIAEELELLQRAQSAIKSGRPSEALSELEEHARRFPHGKLSESREVARIVALCDAGQKAASRTAAARFLAARPNSPFAHRVRSACGGSD